MDGSLWDRFWGIFGLGEEPAEDQPDTDDALTLRPERGLRRTDAPPYGTTAVDSEPTAPVISPRTKRWDFAGMSIFQSCPRTREDAQQVANKLKARLPVVINLEQLDETQTRRLVDFLSGVTYALDGHMKRIARGVYLCSPLDIPIEEIDLTPRHGETLFDYDAAQAANA
jgi:FtsZ-interacting cell division protein YlmF